MSRTWILMAMAFGVTAIASSATPGVAFPSQAFGGAIPPIAEQLHALPATLRMQTSEDAGRVLEPHKVVDVPNKAGKASLGTAQIPGSRLPAGRATMTSRR